MSKLATRAELIKLARDFQTDQAALQALTALGPDGLARLRHLCADQLFERYEPLYRRIAAASALVPAKLAVMLGEKVFGPYLGGRIGSQLELQRALKFASMSSPQFLAEICTSIDPRRVIDIIHGISIDRTLEVTRLLLAKRDYITMGRFVDALTEEQLRAALGLMDEPDALLMTGFYTEGKARLESIVALLEDARLEAIFAHSVQSGQLTEALGLLTHLGDTGRTRLANIAATAGTEILAELVRLAADDDLWSDILPVALLMNEENQQRLLQIPELRDPAVLEGLLRSGHALRLWEQALPMLAHSDESFRATLLQIPFLYERETVLALLEAVNRTETHRLLLDLFAEMGEADQQAVFRAACQLETDLLEYLLSEARHIPGVDGIWIYGALRKHVATARS